MKMNSHNEWVPCASGELGRMVGRIKSRRRVRLVRRVAMGSAAVLLLALCVFSSPWINRLGLQEQAKRQQAKGSGELTPSVDGKAQGVETARTESAGPNGAAAPEGAHPADPQGIPDRNGASEDDEAIAVIKEKVDEAPAGTEVAAKKPHVNCSRAQNLMMKFIRKELDDDLALAVKNHIVGCKWCKKWYTALGGPPLTAQASDLTGDSIASSRREVEWLQLASTPWMRDR